MIKEKRDYLRLREQMVEMDIRPQVSDDRIVGAFLKIPRHKFVAKKYRVAAYKDKPLPIGYEQTISQPSLVARMIELAGLKGDEKVLEIGTGSGYQTALLSLLAKTVVSVERIPALAEKAERNLAALGLMENIEIVTADGTLGIIDQAPFEAIIVTAAGPKIPETLIEQLKEGGRVVMPVAENRGIDKLLVGVKMGQSLSTAEAGYVSFVPLLGKHGFRSG